MQSSTRLVHCSDFHFGTLSLNPLQMLSKQWLGTANLVLKRGREFSSKRLFTLPSVFQKLGVEHIVITGDLTTTSHHKEFQAAVSLIDQLQGVTCSAYVIPGNHDHYTKSAYKQKRFYQYFPKTFDNYCLEKQRLTIKKLTSRWWLIALDTTLATPLYSANGLFSEELAIMLEQALASIPNEHYVVLANHFPFFFHENPLRRLKGGEKLRAILSNTPKVKLYLHGHTHRHTLADLRESALPIVLDSGSAAKVCRGTWNYLSLYEESIHLTIYRWKESQWTLWQTHHYQL